MIVIKCMTIKDDWYCLVKYWNYIPIEKYCKKFSNQNKEIALIKKNYVLYIPLEHGYYPFNNELIT